MSGPVGRVLRGVVVGGVLCVMMRAPSARAETPQPAPAPRPDVAEVAAARVGVGFDARLGLPGGTLTVPGMLGLDLALEPFRALGVTAGGESNGLAVAPRVGVHLFPLRAFDRRLRWSPSLSASYAWLRFTRAADRLLERVAPGFADDLAQIGTDARVAGLSLHTGRVSVGVDYAGHDGFRFRLAVGRTISLGRSRSPHADGLVLGGYQSWTLELVFGWRG